MVEQVANGWLKQRYTNRGTSTVDVWHWKDGSSSVNINVHRVKNDIFEQLAKTLGLEIQSANNTRWLELKLGEDSEVSIFEEQE